MSGFFYPNAILRWPNGDAVCKWSTFDLFLTEAEALKCIEDMRKECEVFCSWIDNGNGIVIDFKCYTDATGYVVKPIGGEKNV